MKAVRQFVVGLFVASVMAIPVWSQVRASWGSVRIEQDSAGRPVAILENSKVRLRWGHGDETPANFALREITRKRAEAGGGAAKIEGSLDLPAKSRKLVYVRIAADLPARYDFFATHCTFTMTKMPPDGNYWVLYEGTPGGSYDDTDWWMTSAVKARQPMTTNHEGDIPAPEWIAFGDAKLNRALFLFNHQDDDRPDRFYQMQKQMTVFGFGRHRGEKHFTSVPRSFSIGLLETTDHTEIGRAVEKIARAPAH